MIDFAEARALIRLATPMALSQLVLMGMGLTDVIVAGRASTIDLAGMTLGGNAGAIVIYTCFGVGMAAAPLVSRFYAAKDFAGMTKQIQQVVWTCALAGFVCFLSMLLLSFFIGRGNFEPGIQEIATSYIAVMSLSGFAVCMIGGLRSSLESIEWTVPVLVINCLGFLINIPLDIIFVNGYFGLPKLGGVGCAISTVTIQTAIMISFFFLLTKATKKRQENLFENFDPPIKKEIFKILKLGAPIGLSMLIELGFFCGAGVLIVYFGAVTASAHAVAISVASATYMIYYGISQAITIRASHHLGLDRHQAAATACYTGIQITLSIAVCFTIAFILFRQELVGLFSQDPAVIKMAASLLILSGLFQLADATQITALCGLRAYLDTRSPLIAQFIAFWIIAFPLGIYLSRSARFPALNGAHGFWLAMCFGLGLAAIILMWMLFRKIRAHSNHAPSQVGI